jgi:AcrR family transcriptional regulator
MTTRDTLSKSSKGRLPAAERRKQLIEVASRVFARNGYVNASTAEIASQAGISEPTIYRHFESKQALYLSVIEQTTDELVGTWQRIAQQTDDPLLALSQMSSWYQAQMSVKPELLEFRFRSIAACEEPAIREAVSEGYRRVIRLVRGQFERAIALGKLPASVDPRVPTALFIALGALSDVVEHLDLADELGGSGLPSVAESFGALFRKR